MRLILSFILACVFTLPAFAASAPDAAQVRQELEQAKSAKASPAQAELVQTLESALGFINARNESLERAKQYQQVIDDFPKLARELRQQIASLNDSQRTLRSGMTSAELDQEILQVSSQLLEEGRQAQQEQDRAREISDSLGQLPQQQSEARRALSESERTLHGQAVASGALTHAQNYARQAESAALKARVDELELAQLSANNRQELARMRAEVHQKKAEQLDDYLQALRNQLNSLRQREAEQALARTEQLAENS
ncbi:MAG TPA: miniconductance mechanosensitive channel MscM, partial [Erwiniaceae bacterium]|nr:miniconductance mechanosensitive channel MscM [Erwiniaceae bacterium]